MISITKTNNVRITDQGETLTGEFCGNSGDTKPTEFEGKAVGNGSTYIEIDTGKFYMYDGENQQWKEI